MPRGKTLTRRPGSIEDDAKQIARNLDTDDVEIEEHDGMDDPDAPKKSLSWSTEHFVRMYQPKGFSPDLGPRRDPDTVWYPSMIHEQLVSEKAKMKDPKGFRRWYRESELPTTGARIFDAADFATLQCPAETCGMETGNGPKKCTSWAQLAAHVEAKHTNEWKVYKEVIEAKVKTEADVTLDKIYIKGRGNATSPSGALNDE